MTGPDPAVAASPNGTIAEPAPAPAGPQRAGNAIAYRFTVGAVRATAISDGQARFPAYPAYAPNAAEAEVRAALRGHGLDEQDYLLNATALLLQTEDATVLVDAGAGAALGPGFGRLPAQLTALGVDPGRIDRVHITHAHLDHIGGLVDTAGTPVYPRAALSIAAAEWTYWTDPDLDLSALPIDPAFRDAFTATARAALPPYAARVELFDDSAVLAPGITARVTGCHTPGHSTVAVQTGAPDTGAGPALLVVGDLFHHEAFDLAHPHWCTAFDWRPEAMPALRRDVLGRAADENTLVFAYHAPFPGLGRVFRDGDGFRFEPTPWSLDP